MKTPKWLRVVWWLLLVGLATYFLWQRFDSITSGATNATDIVIFLIWIALLTIPLFQEVSIFGVSFKKEIDKLKTEFKEQIINLRSEIHNTINMRTEISPRIQFLTPPADSELPSIEERIRPILERILREQGLERPVVLPKEQLVPDDTNFLFSVRYTLENEIRRIWQRNLAREPERGQPFHIMLSSLESSGIINLDLYHAIQNVYSICTAAIHGEATSDNAINFVRNIAPELIASLKSI